MFNPDRPFLFGKDFFEKHQQRLLRFANCWIGRYVFRIYGKRSDVGKNKITKIVPNAIFWDESVFTKKAEFRTHNKYSKRLFHAFYFIWYLFHVWDTIIANTLKPAWNLGFDSLTVYPDASVETTSVDGYVYRGDGTDQTFTALRDGAGSVANDTAGTNTIISYISTTTTTDKWDYLYRSFFLFDTSALNDGATITAGVLSFYITNKTDVFSQSVGILASNPASNTAIAAGDYAGFTQTTRQATDKTIASITTSAYNDWTLNATGISNISLTSITKFGVKTSADIDNVEPTWSSNVTGACYGDYADTAG